MDNSRTQKKDVPPLTIIGVVGHTVNDPPGSVHSFERLVQMHFLADEKASNMMLMVRVASGDPLRLAEPVRQEVLAIDPELAVADVSTMDANIAAGFAPQRLTMVLLGTFALLALVLASIGLYGVMALGVTQRTRELGIRLALGAQPSMVLRLILGQSAKLVGAGLALGLAAAFAAGQLLSSIVYGVTAVDPGVLAAVAALLGAVALLASYMPARRAMRINPLAALREE